MSNRTPADRARFKNSFGLMTSYSSWDQNKTVRGNFY